MNKADREKLLEIQKSLQAMADDIPEGARFKTGHYGWRPKPRLTLIVKDLGEMVGEADDG